jgi:CBS domain-containing protein
LRRATPPASGSPGHAVDEMIVAFGVSRQGIDSDTPDKKRLHAVCLLLTPRSIAQLYLQTLSAIATFARQEGNVEKLTRQPDAAAVIRVIWDTGLTIKKQLTVRDIMHRNIFYTTPEATLKDVANIFYRHKVSGVPVVDSDEKVIGIISEKHLIKAALPDYESLIENMSFTPDVEPFDELLKREDEIKVAEIMTRKVVTTTEDTPIVEVAAMMMFRNIRRVPVINDEGHLLGMVLRSDIVSKVIRG